MLSMLMCACMCCGWVYWVYLQAARAVWRSLGVAALRTGVNLHPRLLVDGEKALPSSQLAAKGRVIFRHSETPIRVCYSCTVTAATHHSRCLTRMLLATSLLLTGVSARYHFNTDYESHKEVLAGAGV